MQAALWCQFQLGSEAIGAVAAEMTLRDADGRCPALISREDWRATDLGDQVERTRLCRMRDCRQVEVQPIDT